MVWLRLNAQEKARKTWTNEYLGKKFDGQRLGVAQSDTVHHMYGRTQGAVRKARLRGKLNSRGGLVLGGGEGRNHTVDLTVRG